MESPTTRRTRVRTAKAYTVTVDRGRIVENPSRTKAGALATRRNRIRTVMVQAMTVCRNANHPCGKPSKTTNSAR